MTDSPEDTFMECTEAAKIFFNVHLL